MLSSSFHRYEKHLLLTDVGLLGQERLEAAQVAVVGVGGLGCPALQQLVAAGVGKVTLIDGDRVEVSNLPWQILFTEAELGKNKAEVAAKQLHRMNPHPKLAVHPCFLTKENAPELLKGASVVIDATDRSEIRYVLSAYSEQVGCARVYGAVEGMRGQVAVFNVQGPSSETYSYQDLFPEEAESACTCSQSGILGGIPLLLGNMQALEAIKVLLGRSSPLQSHVLQVDYADYRQVLSQLTPNPRSVTPLILRPITQNVEKVSYNWVQRAKKGAEAPLLVDVRDPWEAELPELSGLRIPLKELLEKGDFSLFEKHPSVLFYCQTGKRSALAAQILKKAYPWKEVYTLNQESTP